MLLGSLASCDSNGGAAQVPAECGLPTPDRDVDVQLVPAEFLLADAEVTKAQKTKERLTIALNNPHSVEESFVDYKRIMQGSDYAIVGEDNEGFEAEIYLKKGKELGAIQIRSSRCPDATVVFLNFVRT
ncbi:MAG TPA: hypothetical protein VE174_01865 [Actinomycetota bacterium]|nr:hypothetical protein [Actinomycetota bacterium]